SHLLDKGLVLRRRRVAERGVTALAVIPNLDVLEDRQTRDRSRHPDLAVEQFDLERREEALGHGVVEAVSDRAHRPHEASPLELLAESQGRVLATVIRVMDQPGRGVAVTKS